MKQRNISIVTKLLVGIVTLGLKFNLGYAIIPTQPNCNKMNPQMNWSNCDKHGQDLINKALNESLFKNTNFAGANLHGADFGGSILVGANFTGANLYGADFELAIWTNGHLCSADSLPGMCDQLTLNETYQEIKDIFDSTFEDDEETLKLIQKMAQMSIHHIIPEYRMTFAQAEQLAANNNAQLQEDLILQDFPTANDQVVVLRSGNDDFPIFRAYSLPTFLVYVNSNNFKIQTPDGNYLSFVHP